MKPRKSLVVMAMVAFLCVNLMTMGCETLKKLTTSAPVNFICQPTPEQQQTAAMMLVAIDAAQAIGAAFFPVIGIAKASAVLTTIKGGGCWALDQLAEAFKVVDAANAATAQAQMKAGKKMAVALPEYAPLRKLIK